MPIDFSPLGRIIYRGPGWEVERHCKAASKAREPALPPAGDERPRMAQLDDEYQKVIADLVEEARLVGATSPETEVSPSTPPASEPSVSLPPRRSILLTPAGNIRAPFEWGLHIVYFDLEIRRELGEIGGWDGAIRDGGISCLCLWDSGTEKPYFYDEGSLDTAMNHLEGADVVVSFNGKAFDVPLITSHAKRAMVLKEHFDLFELVKMAKTKVGEGWGGNGLGKLCEMTFGQGKTGVGSDAPGMVRDGKWMELVGYCLNDVYLTRDLCTFVRRNGFLMDKDGVELRLDVPEWFAIKRID
jgi:DEAD/DEAH box helicase domain-containing protein